MSVKASPSYPLLPFRPLGLVQLETHLLTINSMEKLLLMDTTEARRKAISKGVGIGWGVQRLTHLLPGGIQASCTRQGQWESHSGCCWGESSRLGLVPRASHHQVPPEGGGPASSMAPCSPRSPQLLLSTLTVTVAWQWSREGATLLTPRGEMFFKLGHQGIRVTWVQGSPAL